MAGFERTPYKRTVQTHPSGLANRLPKCYNCDRFGHVSKACKAQKSNFNTRTNPKRVFRQFEFEQDNEAHAAYRRRESPTSSYTFPRGFHPPQLKGELSRPTQIAVATNTHIVFKSGLDAVAQVWGTAQEVATAIRALQEWVDEVQPPGSRLPKGDNRSFAKSYGHDWFREANVFNQTSLGEGRQRFRQDVRTGHFVYWFGVPWNSTSFTPRQVLGNNLEALDPIRMTCEVYISVSSPVGMPDAHYFVLLGNDKKLVNQAIKRLRTIDKQVASRYISPYQFYLVKAISEDRLTKTIRLSEAKPGMIMALGDEDMALEDIEYRDPECSMTLETLEAGSIVISESHADHVNALYLEFWIMSTLYPLKFYVGRLHMRASIGSCNFTVYPKRDDNIIELEHFQECLEEKNRQDNQLTSVFKPVADRDQTDDKNMLERFAAAAKLVLPVGSLSKGGMGDNIKPKCSVVFIIKGSGQSEEDYQLEIAFGESSRGTGIPHWSRIPLVRNDNSAVDINILDIKDSNLSYNINLTTSTALDAKTVLRLPRAYRTFAEKVKVVPGRGLDINCTSRFVEIPKFGTIPVIQIQQKRSWRFAVNETSYLAELFLTQTSDLTKETSLGNNDVILTADDQRWHVEVWHPIWDTNLASNAALGIGGQANWAPAEWAFFPQDRQKSSKLKEDSQSHAYHRGHGCGELLRVLDIVAGIMKGKPLAASREKGKEVVAKASKKVKMAEKRVIKIDKPQPPEIHPFDAPITELVAFEGLLIEPTNKSEPLKKVKPN